MYRITLLWLMALALVFYGCGNDDSESDGSSDTDGDTDTDSDTDTDTDTDSDTDSDCIDRTIEHDGLLREYILCVPESYSGNESLPLVFNFHGYGQNNNSFMNLADLRPNSDSAGFLLVYPQGTLFEGQSHWNVGGNWSEGSTVDDVGFTEAMIDSLSSEYSVDLTRVYATGYSNGGYMSYHLACQLSDKIAAIAAVAGTMTPATLADCNPEHPTPTLQIHGTADPSVPYDGDTWTESIDTVMQFWVDYDNCAPKPETTAIKDSEPDDGSTVEHIAYSECDNGVTVEHFKVTGGAHDWPGSWGNMDISASDEIWNFFSKYNIDGLIE